MAVLFANRAVTRLARPLYSNELSMLVCGTERFPLNDVIEDGDWFRVTLSYSETVCLDDGSEAIQSKQESVRVTAIDAMDPRLWTIERNQDQNEIPLDFPDGSCVEMRLDALVLDDLQAQIEGEAGEGGCHCPVASLLPPTFTPSFGDEWFDTSVVPWIVNRWDGAQWVPTGQLFDPTVPEYINPVIIPAATITDAGVVILATQGQIETCGAGDTGNNVVTISALCAALSNGFLAGMVPGATTENAGVVEFATEEEFLACCQSKVVDVQTLCANIAAILPQGNCTTEGIFRAATLVEAESCLANACDPNDLVITMGVLCDLRSTEFFDSIPCPTACVTATDALEVEVCTLRSALFALNEAAALAATFEELRDAITTALAGITECV